MTLDWLDFEASEDAEGRCSFDAMASASPSQLPALQAEVVRVLQWAEDAFGAPGPLDEGHEWDCELQGVREVPTPLDVRYDAGRLVMEPRETGSARVTLSLTVVGSPGFCAAFRPAFGID